jgi:hypothetical protein
MLVMGTIGCSAADNSLVGTNLTPSDAAAGTAAMPDANASGGAGGGVADAVGSGGAVGGALSSGGVADGAVGSGGAAGGASGATAGRGDSAQSDGAVADLPTRPEAAIDRGLGGDSPRIGDSSSDTATTCASLGESCATQPCCGSLICQTSRGSICLESFGPPPDSGTGDTGGSAGPCDPPVSAGTHSVHFRYIWAGKNTFTFFPKPAVMPQSIELRVNGNKLTCPREMDRPWFNCAVPDSYFFAGSEWLVADKTRSPEWNTVVPRDFPDAPKNYWLRWNYGRPDLAGTTNPPTFKFFDYYPDENWAATGQWNDSQCKSQPPTAPAAIGFGNGAWFPYSKTQYLYPNGGSLAYIYSDSVTAQDALNAFVWERYGIWKANYIETSDSVCGPGTARVRTDPPKTVSEGQGYGMAISAAIGDKATFDALWSFVRHYLSQAADTYCGGLMGWMWDGSIPCRPLDSPCDPAIESCSGNEDSAFDGDVDIGIGLVYAALQWPSDYKQFAIDWLTKMECEINTKYDGVWNYPTVGDTYDKSCANYPGQPCSYTPGTPSTVYMDYYPPGYFRVFGDYLAANVDSSQKAANGQSHHDFWYKVAETVYQMLEECYDQPGLNPGLVGASGDTAAPCRNTTMGAYEELRSLWRVGIDAAWFGDASLPETAANSSSHYGPKSRMQAKIDNSQDFFNSFYKNNPVEANANRFSSICDSLRGDGKVTNCDPALGHNSYTVNMAMCSYVSLFNDAGSTTTNIRQEAIEEAISTTIENSRYFQESLGVYSDLFLTGNFPNPMTVPKP